MKVLVACEYSGIVRTAFAAIGHDAWSCDLLPTEIPGQHIQGDALKVAYNDEWDMMIAHPPCTYLSVSGARWWAGREHLQAEAYDFATALAHAPIPRICIENPVGALSRLWRKPDQWIQPWQFGHGECKKTGLWLRNLPLLRPSKIVAGRESRIHSMPPGPDRGKLRSMFFEGIAEAMANQWGNLENRYFATASEQMSLFT